MKIQGIEPITPATRVALRTLVTTCLATIAFNNLEFENATLDIFGLLLARESAVTAIRLAIVFQAVSYSIFWLGDFFSLGHWNAPKSMTDSPFGGGKEELKTRVQKSLEHLKNIENWIKDYAQKTDGPTNCDSAVEHLNRIEGSLKELIDRSKFQSRYFKLYFYGWHALMPIVLVFIALFYPPSVPPTP